MPYQADIDGFRAWLQGRGYARQTVDNHSGYIRRLAASTGGIVPDSEEEIEKMPKYRNNPLGRSKVRHAVRMYHEYLQAKDQSAKAVPA
jgi:hypothetical protein